MLALHHPAFGCRWAAEQTRVWVSHPAMGFEAVGEIASQLVSA